MLGYGIGVWEVEAVREVGWKFAMEVSIYIYYRMSLASCLSLPAI